MGVYRFHVSLSSSHSDGSSIGSADFVDLLSILPSDAIAEVYSDQGRWATSRVEFLDVVLSDFSDANEPTEIFAVTTQSRLLEIAGFLDRQSVMAFTEAREQGLKIYIYMEVRMDQDQMDLSLPAPFLSSCARLGLSIDLMSNDISAAEAVTLGWV